MSNRVGQVYVKDIETGKMVCIVTRTDWKKYYYFHFDKTKVPYKILWTLCLFVLIVSAIDPIIGIIVFFIFALIVIFSLSPKPWIKTSFIRYEAMTNQQIKNFESQRTRIWNIDVFQDEVKREDIVDLNSRITESNNNSEDWKGDNDWKKKEKSQYQHKSVLDDYESVLDKFDKK